MVDGGHADLCATSESVSTSGEEDDTAMDNAERELESMALALALPSTPPLPQPSSSPYRQQLDLEEPHMSRSYGGQPPGNMASGTDGDDEHSSTEDGQGDEESQESEESGPEDDWESLADMAHLQFEDGDFDQPWPADELQEDCDGRYLPSPQTFSKLTSSSTPGYLHAQRQ